MASGQKKGRKFGRNRDRKAGRSMMQAKRTERNKRLRMEKAVRLHGAKSVGHVCPKIVVKPEPVERMVMGHLVKDHMTIIREGRIVATHKAIPVHVKGYFVDYRYELA
jgi:hypothetical protein